MVGMLPKNAAQYAPAHEKNGAANGKPLGLDRFLSNLKKVRKSSNGWQACCPAHDDTTPSLSVSIGNNGSVVMFCHAGCQFADILSAVGMCPRDLAAGGPAQSKSLKKKPSKLDELIKAAALGSTGGQEVPERLSADEEHDFYDNVVKRANKRMVEDPSKAAPFPLHVFPEPLRQFVMETAESIPSPADYIGLGVLAVVSSFIGAGRPIQPKSGWIERSAIYGMIVGPTGSRKSPALKLAMTPARRHEEQLALEYKIAKKKHAQKRQLAKSKKDDFDDPPPVAKQHVTTDTTVEALADVLAWNPRGLLVYRDEGAGWVASLNQYKGGKGADRQFWLSAWSCQDYTVNRKGKEPLRITSPFLSVIGNIPPDMLGELVDRRGREDGFIDRILFAYPDPVLVEWTDKSPDPRLLQLYVGACQRIGKMPKSVLTFDKQARIEFALWYNEHNRSSDGPAGTWAKLDGYCARFANILHHLKVAFGEKQALKSLSALKVDVASVRGAIELIDYFKNHARRALGRMRAGQESKVLARLLPLVMASPDYRVRPRALIAAQIAANANDAKTMLTKLVAMGLGEMVQGKRKDEIFFQGREDLEVVISKFDDSREQTKP